MVNGEFYFTSLLLDFLRRLVVARKPIFRLTVHNELTELFQVNILVHELWQNDCLTLFFACPYSSLAKQATVYSMHHYKFTLYFCSVMLYIQRETSIPFVKNSLFSTV